MQFLCVKQIQIFLLMYKLQNGFPYDGLVVVLDMTQPSISGLLICHGLGMVCICIGLLWMLNGIF